MKRYIAIGVAALLLAGVVYWSCSINSVKKTKTDDPGMTLDPNISANGADSVLSMRERTILKASGLKGKAQGRLKLNILMK